MIQKVFYGDTNAITGTIKDIAWNEKLVLGVLVLIIFAMGLFPQPVIDVTKETVTAILTRFK